MYMYTVYMSVCIFWRQQVLHRCFWEDTVIKSVGWDTEEFGWRAYETQLWATSHYLGVIGVLCG